MKSTVFAAVLLACAMGPASAQDHRPGAELACYEAWDATRVYEGDAQVSDGGRNFVAKYRTQGNKPAQNSGADDSGQPWSGGYACGAPMVERAPIPSKYLRMARSMVPADGPIATASLPTNFIETQVAHGLIGPTRMEIHPDGRVFVLEQTGAIRVIKNNALLSTPYMTLKVDTNGERGTLGLAFDPGFATNHYFYVYYTATSPTIHNRVSRFTQSSSNPDTGDSSSEKILLELPTLGQPYHNGGAIHFASDGTLYIAVGDNKTNQPAQSTSSLLGKILRINADGSIPSSNPFYTSTSGNYRSIWAIGLRNPYTFAFQPGTGKLLINDVGEATWEEVDTGKAGANYGWPNTEGKTTDPKYSSPFYVYNSSTGTECAIIGSTFYNPTTVKFPSSYVGKYFFMDYCAGWIRTLDTSTAAASTFATGISYPVDLRVAPDGSLWYLSRGSGSATAATGTVYKVEYFANGGAPTISVQPLSQSIPATQPVTFTVAADGKAPLSYQWYRNGSAISGATGTSYKINAVTSGDNGAKFHCKVNNSVGNVTTQDAVLTVTAANHPPVPTITTPADGTTYRAGDTISFSGTATDQEDGNNLPASDFTWEVTFQHDTHFHPFYPPTSGIKSGSFTIPTTGETSSNVWYRIHLTVKDSGGLQTEVIRDVLPLKSNVTLAGSPTGTQVTLDGQPFATPYTFTGVQGMQRDLGAPAQIFGGKDYGFGSWSDAGAQTHTISTPTANTTYTAKYTVVTPTNIALNKSVTASTQNGTTYQASNAVDGNLATRWSSTSPTGQWFQVDLGKVSSVSQIVLKEFESRVTAYTIEVSADGVVWSTAYHGTKASGSTDTTTTINLPEMASARYVKLDCDSAVNNPRFWEIQVMGF